MKARCGSDKGVVVNEIPSEIDRFLIRQDIAELAKQQREETEKQAQVESIHVENTE
jgi:hypothetical protein